MEVSKAHNQKSLFWGLDIDNLQHHLTQQTQNLSKVYNENARMKYFLRRNPVLFTSYK